MIANPGSAVEPHDEQQARVVERLRAANGVPVSFAELRAMGVENPALLCYELAAVGLPVERPREPGSSARALSVQLPPSLDGPVRGSGGSLSRCMEPTGEACLTYAYALYDLGRALQLDGDPAAATPILSERLRIDSQRETVQQELDLARAADA